MPTAGHCQEPVSGMALTYLTGILIMTLTIVNSLLLLYISGGIFELAP